MSERDLQRVTNSVDDISHGQSPRRLLPPRHHHITQKFKIAGQRTLFISVHDDARPREIFLRLKGSDCSSELLGLYDVIAGLMSLALQYGNSPRLEGRGSPCRRQICAMRPGVWARLPQAVFESARSDRVTPAWWSTAAVMSRGMFLEQHRRRAHHDFESARLTKSNMLTANYDLASEGGSRMRAVLRAPPALSLSDLL